MHAPVLQGCLHLSSFSNCRLLRLRPPAAIFLTDDSHAAVSSVRRRSLQRRQERRAPRRQAAGRRSMRRLRSQTKRNGENKAATSRAGLREVDCNKHRSWKALCRGRHGEEAITHDLSFEPFAAEPRRRFLSKTFLECKQYDRWARGSALLDVPVCAPLARIDIYSRSGPRRGRCVARQMTHRKGARLQLRHIAT